MTVCFISYQFLSKSSKETIQIPLKNILSHTYIHIHKISEASFRGISSLVSKERREGENGETKVKEFREQERRCFERAVDATLENRVPDPSLSRSSRLPIVAREPRAKIIEGRGWEGGRRRRLQSLHDKSVSRIHPRRTAARNDRAKWRRIVFADRERERERVLRASFHRCRFRLVPLSSFSSSRYLEPACMLEITNAVEWLVSWDK